MFELLSKSFYSAECIKSLDSEMRETLLSAELIFKNAHGRLISFSAKDKVVKILHMRLTAIKL